MGLTPSWRGRHPHASWADKYGGSAVATRWPHRILETLDLRLPDAPDVPWCTLAASVTIPDQGELLFIARCETLSALAGISTKARQGRP